MTKRSTTTRTRHRRYHRNQGGPCSICLLPIDYDLASPHPMSFVVDHVIPLHRGGQDVIDNTAPAHRVCNRAKSDLLPGEMSATGGRPRVLETSRSW